MSFHPSGTPFENDKWELFHLDRDFSEADNLADKEPERLAEMIELWWSEAEAHNVLPLDDRFGPRFAENAARFHGARHHFTFHAGMGHVPTDVAPDVRSRSYTIEAHVEIADGGAEGVLIAHGDATSGYSLYIKDGHLVHDLNIGGGHEIVRSERKIAPGSRTGSACMWSGWCAPSAPAKGARTGFSAYTLLIDGEPAGSDADAARLPQFHLVVGPRHRPRPRQPGVALRGAVRVHGQAEARHREDARRPEARRRGRRQRADGAAVGVVPCATRPVDALRERRPRAASARSMRYLILS